MKRISFKRGDTYAFKFQRLDAEDNVIEIVSQNMWFTVKKNYNTTDKILQKTLEDGIVFDENFYYHVLINSVDTRDLKYGDYVYDIQVENNGVVSTIAIGQFTLEQEVTTDYA